MFTARTAFLGTVTFAILATVLIGDEAKAGAPAETKASRTDPYGDPLPEGVRTRLGTIRFRVQQDDRQLLISPDAKVLALTDRAGIALVDAVSGRRLRDLRVEGNGTDGFSPLHFSPDNWLLATVDRRIRIWEIAGGKEIWGIPLSEGEEVLGRFSTDGKTFLTWGRVKGLRVWEAASGKLLRRLALSSAADWFNTAVSPDGRLLAAPADAHTLRLWDVGAGKEVRTLARLDRPIDTVRFSPDGRRLAVVDNVRRAIHLWDVKTAEKVLIRTRDQIHPMRFSADGKSILSICTSDNRDKTLYAWDTSSGKELWRVSDVHGCVCYFALSPDGGLLADVEEQSIVFRNLRSGKPLRRCATPLAWEVFCQWGLAYSPDGRFLLSRDGRALRVWAAATGREREDPPGHLGPPDHISFSADGRRVAVAARGLVRVWDADTGKAIQTFRGHEGRDIDSLAFSPDGRTGASCGSLLNSTLRAWDADTGRERYQFEQPAVPVHKGTYGILAAFSPDGKLLAVASQMSAQIDVRDAATGKKRLPIHRPGYVLGLAFSPAAATLAVLTEGKHPQIEFWNIATGRPEGIPLPDGGEMVFSCDGRLLATLGKKTIRVWELVSGKAVCTFQFPPACRDAQWSVSFTPSGALLAAAIVPQGEEPWWTDNVLELWDAIRGKRLRRLRVAGNRFEKAAFAPGGRYLATAMADTSVLLWEPSVVACEPEPRRELGAGELTRLWGELAGADAEGAYRALRTASGLPDQAVVFLETRLPPAGAGDLPQVIADLDAADLARREAAQRRLIRRGPEAIFALRATLRGTPTLEMRKRIELILEALKDRPLTPEMLRQMRAVQLLEQVNTPAARRLLERLSRGAPEALLTQEAKSSLGRMARQAKTP